jgi:hypothetical protein
MMLRRIVGLIVAGFVTSMVVSAIAAMQVKQRIVPTTDPDADEIALAAIFGPLAFSGTSKQFRGGTVDCWFGGGVLDLRGATLAPEGATLRVRGIYGGGQILVPADWAVTTQVQAIFGGVTNNVSGAGGLGASPGMTVTGIMLFGGFAVTSELEAGEAQWLEEMQAKDSTTTNGPTAADPEAELTPAG